MSRKKIRFAVFVPDQDDQLPVVMKWGSDTQWAWGNPDEERMMRPGGVYDNEREATAKAIAAWLEKHGDPRTLMATLRLEWDGES